MMIYFACSVTGGRQDEFIYRVIVDALVEQGHRVPTAHLSSADMLSLEEIADPEEVYQRDIAWISACDALIAEVSTPSHGVGYEIGYALEAGKPVLCCYRQGVRVSKMILGNRNPRLWTRSYRFPQEAVRFVEEFLLDVSSGK